MCKEKGPHLVWGGTDGQRRWAPTWMCLRVPGDAEEAWSTEGRQTLQICWAFEMWLVLIKRCRKHKTLESKDSIH